MIKLYRTAKDHGGMGPPQVLQLYIDLLCLFQVTAS
jgi:hypothetical protein